MGNVLICEGRRGGLDDRVLNMLVVQKFALEVMLYPACGDASLRSVAEHYRERSRLRGDGLGESLDRVFTIEDRNYRSRQVADDSWRSDSRRFIWRRHEIENYLLDFRVVAQVFENLCSYIPRSAALPTLASQVDLLMQELARPMVEHFVGWLTYWQLVGRKKELVDLRFLHPDRRRPLRPARYPDRQVWLEYLHQECARLCADCQTFCQAAEFDDLHIDRCYDRNLDRCTHCDFWEQGRYIEEMGGHELVSALLGHLNVSGIPISLGDFETELLTVLDRLYEPGFYEVDDFKALADKLSPTKSEEI